MRALVLVAFAVCAALAPDTAAAPVPKAGPPRLIAVASHKDLSLWGIYVVHPDTGECKRLTDPKKVCYRPVWSPDGSRIAFNNGEIWTMKPDGTDLRQITKTGANNGGYRWWPDGSRITFMLGKDGKSWLHSVEVATGKLTELTDGKFPHGEVTWSPDGKRLAYERRAPDAIHTMKSDGTDDRKVIDGGREAAWSPDGSRIAYATFLSEPTPGWRVFTVGADGKDRKQITTEANPDGYSFPQWSPDGNKIAFGTLVEGVVHVGIVSAAGGEVKVITSGPHPHHYPRWSPDGKSLCYLRTEQGKRGQLVVSDSDGRNAKVLLADVAPIPPEWKPK